MLPLRQPSLLLLLGWPHLCLYDFVPIVFTSSGGMGEQFQRRYWSPQWIRVAEEDEAMKIRPGVAKE